MIERMIIDKKLDICALSKTKMKVSGEFRMGSIRSVKAGVGERCRAREGEAIMLSERIRSMVRKGKGVSSKIVWVRLLCGKEK
jgi:hypothetical protein